ncbi:hypothetical protein P278_09570 [Zhouia amylolytica AD3]|uniref:Uncharacterized protein n=2 Tax=Zhouia amylolytica TaxID=376730 RepID=W2UPL9_9FLAO|nr:hypothetical protein P278_09570 [Zhouia amylolytica AD3]
MFLVLGVLLVVAMSSYNLSPTSTKKKSIDYIAYMRTINKAESYILKEQFDSALVMYKLAFKNVDKPLAGHSFTAMQTSAYLDEIDVFEDFVIETFKCGLTVKDITNDSLLNNYISDKKLYEVIQKKYKRYSKVFKNKVDKILKDSLYKLSKLDQKWKIYYIDSLSKIDPNNSKKYNITYDSIVSDIVENKLIPLIKQYGYPGERNIGPAKNGRQAYRYSFGQETAKIILWHYYRLPKTCSYNDIFFNEVKKGNMPPDQYASIMDFQARHGTDHSCNSEIYNEKTVTRDTSLFSQINSRRKKLGLESLEEKKSKYRRGQGICRKIRKEKKYNYIKLFYWCG